MKNTVFVLWLGLAVADIGWAQNEPYKNPDLSPRERAEDLVKRLTLKEKASLMINSSPAVERLGIKPYNWWSEALHGVARNGLATVYPITMGMASVFDDKLIEDIYVTVSDEGRAKCPASWPLRTGQRRIDVLESQCEHFPRPALGTRAGNLGRGSLLDHPYGRGGSPGYARAG